MARQERSAGVVIYHIETTGSGVGRSYLLLDYGRHWDYPKGHVEAGENDVAAALRELEEETGITDARLAPGFRHEIEYFFRDRRKGLIQKSVVFFLAGATSRDVRLSHEHSGFAFLPYAEALDRVTFKNAKQTLEAAETYLRKQAERSP